VVKVAGRIRELFGESERVKPGLYHYRHEFRDRHRRYHLRVEEDRSGLLTVNASGVLHLNATATELMKLILDGRDEQEAIAMVRRVYRAAPGEVARDYEKIRRLIADLDSAEDACPIVNVDVPLTRPFGRKLSAPYRADLALSYACDNTCGHCYVARGAGEVQPMGRQEWEAVLQRIRDVGIPHVCFTGGEATLVPYLPELIEKAEDLGLVTGVLSNGRRLADRPFVRRLCAAGLDHIQVTLESHDEKVHDRMVGCAGAYKETVQGIRNALDDDIYLVTNTTLCALNADGAAETVEFLKELGVRQFAMNSLIYTGKAAGSDLGIEEADLEPILGLVSEKARELGLRFIWYSPTHYCELDPALFGVGYKRCTAGEYNVCIEPDGQVIPCQSFYQPVGHILRDDWKEIWGSPLFREIRERRSVPEECRECLDFEACGGGCPLNRGDSYTCADSPSEG